MKKTILFDLDGTLTDSQEGILKSIKFALEHFGYTVPDEETLQLFLGPPLVDAFQEHCGLTFEQAEETYFKFRERYGTIGKFENKVYPNIVDLLAKCKTEQYTIALATAKPEHYAKDILDHFELTPYFDVIVGANYESGLLHKKEILEKAREEYILHEPSPYYRDGYNLYRRMQKYKTQHLLFLHDMRVPTTNNTAERCLRDYKRKQTFAMTFRSFESIEELCQSKCVLLGVYNNSNFYTAVKEIFNR